MSINTTKQIQVEQVPINDLKPDLFNPRHITEKELESLTRSIREYGLVDPVLARREDKTIIGGHQRLVAARRLGYKVVPVVFLDLSRERAQLLNIAMNRISGSFDKELLSRLMADLNTIPDIDISLSGFEAGELEKLLKSLDVRAKKEQIEVFDLDTALKASQSTPVAQRGDILVMGDHRLMCGDSTNPNDVATLMDGAKASLLSTDPPYLVDYSGGNHPVSKTNRKKGVNPDKNWDTYVDPDVSVEFFRSFLEIGLQHLKLNSAVYQWHAHRRQALVEEAWKQCGLLVHQQIIWVKARGVLTHSHYLWSHEPCFYGWVQGNPPTRKPPSNERTVWQLDQQGSSMNIHPTQKPIELFMRPIEFHTEVGDICYEPFLGSGTQIIAAERLGRRCFAMEQEPRFVDVARMRWEAFTGEKAVKKELRPICPARMKGEDDR